MARPGLFPALTQAVASVTLSSAPTLTSARNEPRPRGFQPEPQPRGAVLLQRVEDGGGHYVDR